MSAYNDQINQQQDIKQLTNISSQNKPLSRTRAVNTALKALSNSKPYVNLGADLPNDELATRR